MPNRQLYAIHEGLNKHEYTTKLQTNAKEILPIQICTCGALSIEPPKPWQLTDLGQPHKLQVYNKREHKALIAYLTILNIPNQEQHLYIDIKYYLDITHKNKLDTYPWTKRHFYQ